VLARLLRPLARSRAAGRLLIFAYHRVIERADPMLPGEVTASAFSRHVEWLARALRVLPLPEAAERLRAGQLDEGAACITFDDGYASNYRVALPILQRAGIPATFFVCTGFLDGGRMWNDTVIETLRRSRRRLDLSGFGLGTVTIDAARPHATADSLLRELRRLEHDQREACVAAIAIQGEAALPTDLMMTSEEVRRLHALGMDIGAHTVSHPILARVDAARARDEIRAGRDALARLTGATPCTFAYPNGYPGKDYRAEHVALVRELGFTTAVTTAFGAARAEDDPLQLPRIVPWEQGTLSFARRALGAAGSPAGTRV
jgi:peptidoglycan/xylan/chitin deacetylase (PgdA/CDA1 family)